MSAGHAVTAYIEAFRARLAATAIAWGAFALALTMLLLSVAAVTSLIRYGFADTMLVMWRILALGIVVAVAVLLLWRPLRRLDQRRAAERIEASATALDGRLETWLDHISPRAGVPSPRTPILELLEHDVAERLRAAPIDGLLPKGRIRLPAALAGVAALAWLALLTLAPTPWGTGARHFWFGWAIPGAEAPVAIVVTPGDSAVQRGLDLPITARFSGFDPATVELYVRYRNDAEWQHAPMRRTRDGGFDFTLYSIQQPLGYYVAAGARRSEEYRVEVADLPRVENIRVSYTYPAWSGLAPETVEGGEIRALSDTDVRLEVTFDRTPERGEVVLNEGAPARLDDGTAALTVTQAGSYYIADYLGGQRVRLTEDFPITVVEDQKPSIEAVKPGRDFRASSIEEVPLRFRARDDFALDAVRLHFSVNGGDWQQVTLPKPDDDGIAEHVLPLEDLGNLAEEVRYLLPRSEAEEEPDPAAPRRLTPGDIVTYYAEASDRKLSARTDMFLIQVQPFDRRFSQSQQMGGGGEGGGGGQQREEEISNRQKEIMLATWNLIRQRDEAQDGAPQIENNATMLAEMQRTLADQTKTLVQRAQARELTSADNSIRLLVQNLENAVAAMQPAAEHLASAELQEAIAPEQRALQFLLRAESLFPDVEVSFSRNGGGGGGGGGQDAMDFSEMFDLEMDLAKNQYETGSTPNAGGGSAASRDLDETIRKLQELARRQEQLANQANRANDLSMTQRWQQEMLRREAEELRAQLQQLQRGQQPSGGQQQANAQPQSGAEPQANGQQAGSQAGATAPGGERGLSQQTMERLDRAVASMDQAGTQANMSPEQMRRAIEEAGRELRQALEEMSGDRRRTAEQAFDDISRRTSEAYRSQQRMDIQLQQALDAALAARGSSDTELPSGMTENQQADLAERKGALLDEYRELERAIRQAMLDYRAQAPRASERLAEAVEELQDYNVATRLDVARQGIERGLVPQIAAIEGITTSALRDLNAAVAEAARLARGELGGQGGETPQLADSLEALQELRRDLMNGPIGESTAQRSGAATGQEGQPGSPETGASIADGNQQEAQGRGAGRPGEVAAGGPGAGYRGGTPVGPYRGDPRDLNWVPPERWDDIPPERREAIQRQLEQAAREAVRIASQTNDAARPEDAETLRQLREWMNPGRVGRADGIVERQYLDMLALIEQLELSVQARMADTPDTARATPPEILPPDYQKPVAEYYQRLSQ